MTLDIVIVMKLIKKISPPHYEFISWINQYKADEVEVGWFNDRYIALTYTSQHGWKARAIPQFLNTHKYNWEDTEKGFKYDKPIHMTIDLSKETAVISVKNKE